MTTVTEPTLDSPDFDPAVHAVDEQGNPKLRADGAFQKKRGRKPGATGGRTAPSPRRTAGRSSRPSRTATDYRPGITGMFQMAAVPLAFAGETGAADAHAIGEHAPGIAEALNSLAQERPEVAAALDKLLSVGPYGVVVGALVPLAVQLLHNHQVIPEPVAVNLGATPRRTVLRKLRAHAEQYINAEAAAA